MGTWRDTMTGERHDIIRFLGYYSATGESKRYAKVRLSGHFYEDKESYEMVPASEINWK